MKYIGVWHVKRMFADWAFHLLFAFAIVGLLQTRTLKSWNRWGHNWGSNETRASQQRCERNPVEASDFTNVSSHVGVDWVVTLVERRDSIGPPAPSAHSSSSPRSRDAPSTEITRKICVRENQGKTMENSFLLKKSRPTLSSRVRAAVCWRSSGESGSREQKKTDEEGGEKNRQKRTKPFRIVCPLSGLYL